MNFLIGEINLKSTTLCIKFKDNLKFKKKSNH